MIENIIIATILLIIVGGSGYYVYKKKKAGVRCIGCPCSKTCNRCHINVDL